jgi:hypothetical protein
MEVVVRYKMGPFGYLPVVLLTPLGGSSIRTEESAGRKENTEFCEGTVKYTVLA